MGIALGANVGGLTSPISSPQNIVAIGTMDPSPSWPQWLSISIPTAICCNIGIWILILLVYSPGKYTSTSPPELFGSVEHEKINNTQIYVGCISILTIILWCFESALKSYFGEMGVIAIVPLVAFFGTGVLTKDDFNNFLWTVIMLAMGGISLGKAVESSGLLTVLTNAIEPKLHTMNLYTILIIISMLVGIITTFISHTVGAMIILPVVAKVGALLPDPHPRLLVMSAGKLFFLSFFFLG